MSTGARRWCRRFRAGTVTTPTPPRGRGSRSRRGGRRGLAPAGPVTAGPRRGPVGPARSVRRPGPRRRPRARTAARPRPRRRAWPRVPTGPRPAPHVHPAPARGDVAGGAHHQAGPGEASVTLGLSDAEIGQHGSSLGGDQHIARLDVTPLASALPRQHPVATARAGAGGGPPVNPPAVMRRPRRPVGSRLGGMVPEIPLRA
jgi:hypothetical protein